MGKKTRMEEIAEKMQEQDAEQKKIDPWETILPNISKGCVIPVISSAFRMEQIFRELAQDDESTIVEDLIAQWAKKIKYPMKDGYNLTQVAQYYFVERNDDPSARTEIIIFLKKFLWNMANTEVDDPALAAGIVDRLDAMHFSDLVEQLDYPKFPEGAEDPLRLLARFPLPIYMTTSQSDFIERALQAEGKKPVTQICFWSGEMTNIRSEHRTNRDFNPSVTNPLVYHLYGLEDYPQTLVLSEDDYINFLIAMAEDNDSQNPKIPLKLHQAIGESQLLLIGYRLSGWDFRVLFRLIMKFRHEGFSPRGMLIQLRNREYEPSNDKTIEYLNHYFGKKTFDIDWNDAGTLIQKLWNKWNIHR